MDEGYFFSGVIGVTGCDPPVDFWPGVTPPALLSVELFELLVEAFVGLLPASSVDVAEYGLASDEMWAWLAMTVESPLVS
jgi:hypothetical protein